MVRYCKYHEEIGKPKPKVELMKFLKGKQYTDAKDFTGECEAVVMIAKGQNVQGTCKYGTRVDYILLSPNSPYKFVPASYSDLSSKGTSDHHIEIPLCLVIPSYRDAAVSGDPKFDHIDITEKQKVVNECAEAEAWLREKSQQQESLPKYATPVVLSSDVKRKAETLDRFCRPIMTKPKQVAKPQASTETPQTPERSEPQSQGAEAGSDGNSANEVNSEAPPNTEPMDTDKSGAAPSPA